MKVSLLDYTGSGHPAPSLYAAKILIYAKSTRLTQGEELRNKIDRLNALEIQKELQAILMTVRSSWEFVDYIFQVEGVTRAYTHQAVRTRIASYAQQAMRVADMSIFENLMPDTVKDGSKKEGIWNSTMGMIASSYKMLRDLGVPAQDARGVLPTNVLTNILIKMNLRTFADLVGKRENLRAQDEYANVVRAMKKCVLEVHPWTEPFLNPPRTQTPALDELLATALGGRSPVDAPEINQALKELDALKATWG